MAGQAIRSEKVQKFIAMLENMAGDCYDQCRTWEKVHGENDRLALSAQVKGETYDHVAQMLREFMDL